MTWLVHPGIQFPEVVGNKPWGSFMLSGLEIAKCTVPTSGTSLSIGASLRIDVRSIQVWFKDFEFMVNKTTTPKIMDNGTASASAQLRAFLRATPPASCSS